MKAVLISIQPKWCDLIARGIKTIEVRKTRPKIETPFKCYIYETKAQFIKSVKGACTSYGYGRGKVIGSFVCDEIIEDKHGEYADIFYKDGLQTLEEQKKYGKNNLLYGWHISDLKIYDKPKELGEFSYPAEHNFTKRTIKESREMGFICHGVYITRPPQSWCYVEQLE